MLNYKVNIIFIEKVNNEDFIKRLIQRNQDN